MEHNGYVSGTVNVVVLVLLWARRLFIATLGKGDISIACPSGINKSIHFNEILNLKFWT